MFVSQNKRDIALHIEVWTVMGVHGYHSNCNYYFEI